jgi:Ca2+-transporting ATPase
MPLVGMDAYLHRRTQASTQGLRGLLADSARVVRDGAEIAVPATEVVVGDLAIVSTGEPFPADGIVLAGTELRVDESALTGEAYPIAKRALASEPTAGEELVDAEHWAFAGTKLLTGRARVRVVTIGRETLYGMIVQLATGGTRERTPLQRAVAGLVTVLLVSAVLLCVLLAIVRLREGFGWVDAIVSAATLAVAALPEEFPVVLTVFLGVGVYRLARRKALVNRSVAVENVGRVSCICSDKTGTITEGRLRVARVVPANGHDELTTLAMAAAAARLETGDPLDRAILEAAGERDPIDDVLATFPFTEDRRRETVVMRGATGVVAYTKGAPETVLAMCGERDAIAWKDRVGELAAGGHKVIACASRPLAEYSGGEPDRDFELGGLIAIADPVRAEVPTAMTWCREAGIRVIMLTGDHPTTACAVAIEMGLAAAPVVLTGEQLATTSDLAAAVRGVDVVARAMPAQKLSIVRALQRAGEIVAVTGDGVNDVPALQAADVGIAMGQKGARSAREVSSIVLLDDNFGSIVAAIAEGRTLFDNLRSSFQYLLMIHIPLVLTATFIPFAGYPVLYLPIHIVWLEALIHPTALLAFQRSGIADPVVASTRNAEVRLFSRAEWVTIVAVGGAITAFVTLLYGRSLGGGDDHARAMAMVVLTAASSSVTVALGQLRTGAARVVVVAGLAVAVLLVQTPVLASLLHLEPLHLDDWALALACGAVVPLPVIVLRVVRTRRRA